MSGYFDGSVHDCSKSSALAVELLQSHAKPSIRCSTCVELSRDAGMPGYILFPMRGSGL